MPMAIDVARWQGEPVAMVVASSRAIAEDACELIEIEYSPLDPACDMENALAPEAPVIHKEFGNNLAWKREVNAGDVDAIFARDDLTIVERTFRFNRHTGVTLEPRSSVVDYNGADDTLTYWYSGQAPHMMQAVISKHIDIREENIPRMSAALLASRFTPMEMKLQHAWPQKS
jgi:carbon-monoxide dehydrogenase large subunit